MGDREANLREAWRRIAAEPGIELRTCSRILETKAVGLTDQPDFLNAVAEIGTTLEPHELLHRLLAIEQALGRVRVVRWGPRTIDIDILFYGDQVIQDEELIVPHPEFPNRPFFIALMAEIRPMFRHPLLQLDMYQMALLHP